MKPINIPDVSQCRGATPQKVVYYYAMKLDVDAPLSVNIPDDSLCREATPQKMVPILRHEIKCRCTRTDYSTKQNNFKTLRHNIVSHTLLSFYLDSHCVANCA